MTRFAARDSGERFHDEAARPGRVGGALRLSLPDMRFQDQYELRKYLAREVHGRELPRKPPRSERRGPTRDADYRAWIRTLPSLVSGQFGCECCHFGSNGGMSQKASDYTCGPLTPEEHREYHQIGKHAFATKYQIDCARRAAELRAAWQAHSQRGAA